MSASSMTTFSPMPLKRSARLTAVVDLPTPPLPDATAMMALTPSGAWAERGCAPARPRAGGAAAAAGPRPAARSAVSATIAEVTPGTPRTASSAALRTASQRWTTAASTLIEKKTFPSLTTMSESVPVAGSGVPSGDFTAESRSSTASLVAGIALLHSPAAARTARAGQHRTLARSVNVAMHRIRRPAAGRASQVQHHCVACDQHAAGAHFFDLRQHGRVHVGDHDLARGERGEFFAELRPVHVAGDGVRVLVAFDDEQISASRHRNERIRPLRVAGIGEHPAAVRDPHGGRGRAGLVHHFHGVDRESEKFGRRAGNDLDDPPWISPGNRGRSRKEDFERGVETLARPRRSRDEERTRTAAQEMAVHHQENDTAEMVAMQMAEQDALDSIGIDTSCLKGRERGGAAIEQQITSQCLDAEAGIEAAAGTERVARADDGYFHALALGRAVTCACQRRTLANSSGSSSFAGFMKSIATRPVMSATL